MRENTKFLGIDIGGAHIKTTGIDYQKNITHVSQIKCPLWKTTKILNAYVSRLNKKNRDIKCLITMTGELCDNFGTRINGVRKIMQIIKKIKFEKFYITSCKKKLIKSKPNVNELASMNWLATAKFLEKKVNNALIIDFGSTTTDLILIKNSKIRNKFYTDFDRLNNHELVYTGLTRTPTIALNNFVKIKKKKYNLTSEFFSNTADLYRIKKMVPSKGDLYNTTDGKDKSVINSYKRFSRNLSIDFKEKNLKFLKKACDNLIKLQLDLIFLEMQKLMEANDYKLKTPIIVCGIGKKVIELYLQRKKLNVIDFNNYLRGKNKDKITASYHAPATACALLISEIK